MPRRKNKTPDRRFQPHILDMVKGKAKRKLPHGRITGLRVMEADDGAILSGARVTPPGGPQCEDLIVGGDTSLIAGKTLRLRAYPVIRQGAEIQLSGKGNAVIRVQMEWAQPF